MLKSQLHMTKKEYVLCGITNQSLYNLLALCALVSTFLGDQGKEGFVMNVAPVFWSPVYNIEIPGLC